LSPQYESELTKLFFHLKYYYVKSYENVKIVIKLIKFVNKNLRNFIIISININIISLLLPLLTIITVHTEHIY
jgi:hypothetical protein